MGWLRDFCRRRILNRRLAKAERRFEVLSHRLDVFEAQGRVFEYQQTARDIEALDGACDTIEVELRRLDASSLSRWLTNWTIDVIVRVVVGISIILQWGHRCVRLVKRQSAKNKPAAHQ